MAPRTKLENQAAALPAAPTDWRNATSDPAATLPPFRIAARDIMPAAQEPAAIPPLQKPNNPTVQEAAATIVVEAAAPIVASTDEQ